LTVNKDKVRPESPDNEKRKTVKKVTQLRKKIHFCHSAVYREWHGISTNQIHINQHTHIKDFVPLKLEQVRKPEPVSSFVPSSIMADEELDRMKGLMQRGMLIRTLGIELQVCQRNKNIFNSEKSFTNNLCSNIKTNPSIGVQTLMSNWKFEARRRAGLSTNAWVY